MKDAIRAFKALSDETRLRILNVLLQRECCVCEVMQALDISQTRASRNLSALYNAGFLKMRKDGQWSVYSIDKEGMQDYIDHLVKAVSGILKDSKVAEQDVKQLNKAERVGPCCAEKMLQGKVRP